VATPIKDEHFERVAEGVKPDSKRRILLSKILEIPGVTFDVYQNDLGQIILDPRQSISGYEAWLLHNPKALRSLMRGLKQSAERKTKDLGSFASFATDDDERA
jgi:hypothetical protein